MFQVFLHFVFLYYKFAANIVEVYIYIYIYIDVFIYLRLYTTAVQNSV